VTVVRDVAVAVGVVLALLVTRSVVQMLVIPRPRQTGIARNVDGLVDGVYRLVTMRVRDFTRRDDVLASQAAATLFALLLTWLAGYLVAAALILWHLTHSISEAFSEAGSSMFTLGFVAPQHGAVAIDLVFAGLGLGVIAVQIGYLPTLYSAFSRRETEVALLASRAGVPPWGPELLARTRYGLHGDDDDLASFYKGWERWAADVGESHSTYPILLRFRSPTPGASWLAGMIAVMDSAAMLLAIAPSRDRVEPRQCLRMGFTALRTIGAAVGIPVVTDPDPDAGIALTYDEFAEAYDRLVDVQFDVERTAEQAWPHFRGWRVNYEQVAYELMRRTDTVPALWSGPRRWPTEVMAPRRPLIRPPKGA
jgi:hypothetical protein